MGKTNDDRIIAALLSTSTITEAADVVGISRRTINNRMNDPEFKAKLNAARKELWRGCATALQAKLGGAIQTIVEIMEDEKTPQQTRLSAAESIVRNALKISEQADFAERLEAIEKARGTT